jgi:outer membrane protein assembly factor BamB
MASPAVHDGLIYTGDCGHVIHCIDAETGKAVWTHEAGGEVWATPMVADGKVYVGTRRGDFWILAAGRTKEVLARIDLGTPISSTATVASGTVYIATMNRLYAVASQR